MGLFGLFAMTTSFFTYICECSICLSVFVRHGYTETQMVIGLICTWDVHLYILYLDKEVKKVFSPAPIVSFKSARKLSSYLVRAKLYPLYQWDPLSVTNLVVKPV